MSEAPPQGIRSVCADCLSSERLRGLRTGGVALVAVRRDDELERCVMCGFPFAEEGERESP